MYQLLQYGVEAFSLRTLSAGRFVGLVSTRSVAESVFVSQLRRTIREANLDIDSIAEHLHRTKAPTAPVPSKQEAPVDFFSPVVVSVVVLLKQIQPVRQDGLALRRVQSLEAQLKEAQAKLAEAEAGKLTSVRSACSPAQSPVTNLTRQLSAVPPNDGPKPELRRLKPRASQNWQQFLRHKRKPARPHLAMSRKTTSLSFRTKNLR